MGFAFKRTLKQPVDLSMRLQSALESVMLSGSPWITGIHGYNLKTINQPGMVGYKNVQQTIEHSVCREEHYWDFLILLFHDQKDVFEYDSIEFMIRGNFYEAYQFIDRMITRYQYQLADPIPIDRYQWLACPVGQVNLEYTDEHCHDFFNDLMAVKERHCALPELSDRFHVTWLS